MHDDSMNTIPLGCQEEFQTIAANGQNDGRGRQPDATNG